MRLRCVGVKDCCGICRWCRCMQMYLLQFDSVSNVTRFSSTWFSPLTRKTDGLFPFGNVGDAPFSHIIFSTPLKQSWECHYFEFICASIEVEAMRTSTSDISMIRSLRQPRRFQKSSVSTDNEVWRSDEQIRTARDRVGSVILVVNWWYIWRNKSRATILTTEMTVDW